MKKNHKSLVVEYSSKFDSELIGDELEALCDKLCDEYGLHVIINNLSEQGTKSVDKVTNNTKVWERFAKLEADE